MCKTDKNKQMDPQIYLTCTPSIELLVSILLGAPNCGGTDVNV